MRRVAMIAAILLAIVLVTVSVLAVILQFGRGSKKEDEANTASTDVADVPFSEDPPAAPGMTTDPSAAPGTTTDPSAASGMTGTSSGDLVHVTGIEAFALYEYDEASGMRVKTPRHESVWTRGEDIVSLEAFAADTENIVLSAGGGRGWYESWRAYWQQETGSENCRIGYTVSFDLKSGEQIRAVLLKPGDELPYRVYLENYLYDDAANADAGWYSHLEPQDASDSTLLTSIKFTPGERFEEIDGKITVTGFVYDSADDFDADGNYIGDVAFTTELVSQ